MMRTSYRSFALALAACIVVPAAWAQTTSLRSPQDFASISDRTERSRALFVELGKVLQSPRCLNCHPVGNNPTQGDDLHKHLQSVTRGSDGHGTTGMRCTNCHQAANFESARVPGNPKWHLAPIAMGWQGKSLGQICEQIKDPARNGKRTLAQSHEHMAKDDLVGWAWQPGGGRTPAPGTQEQFGALLAAWIETGAACPTK